MADRFAAAAAPSFAPTRGASRCQGRSSVRCGCGSLAVQETTCTNVSHKSGSKECPAAYGPEFGRCSVHRVALAQTSDFLREREPRRASPRGDSLTGDPPTCRPPSSSTQGPIVSPATLSTSAVSWARRSRVRRWAAPRGHLPSVRATGPLRQRGYAALALLRSPVPRSQSARAFLFFDFARLSEMILVDRTTDWLR